ncbi:MAG: carboxypeptidase-like regulatory domain-containing protein, partial [Bryobacteraceae bacterium]
MFRNLLFITLGLATAALPSFAQMSTAGLRGDVLDPSGNVIPKVNVAAINTATRREFKTLTSGEGAYNLPFLPAGFYDVAFIAPGFSRQLIPGIKLEVGQVARLDAHLEVGSVQQTVSVNGESPLIQSSDATVGTVVVESQIRNLPLNGRKFLDLTLLVPGANPSPGGSRQQTLRGTFTSAINVNGSRETSNVYLMDGTLNHDVNYNTFVISPNVDSIQEFRVETNNYSAEFGQQSGAQINLVTKSGTNSLHGTLSEFLRNSALDAKNLFDRPQPASIPAFRQNQFGGTLGGPIRRDRTFFFSSYEGFRQVQAQTSIAIVPNAQV